MTGKNKEAIEQALSPIDTTGHMVGFTRKVRPRANGSVSPSVIRREVTKQLVEDFHFSPENARQHVKETYLKAKTRGGADGKALVDQLLSEDWFDESYLP